MYHLCCVLFVRVVLSASWFVRELSSNLSFNAAKCEVVRISRKKTVLQKINTIKGQALQEVDKARYLGVIISNDLQLSTQVSTITKNANSTVAFLRRNLK